MKTIEQPLDSFAPAQLRRIIRLLFLLCSNHMEIGSGLQLEGVGDIKLVCRHTENGFILESLAAQNKPVNEVSQDDRK